MLVDIIKDNPLYGVQIYYVETYKTTKIDAK